MGNKCSCEEDCNVGAASGSNTFKKPVSLSPDPDSDSAQPLALSSPGKSFDNDTAVAPCPPVLDLAPPAPSIEPPNPTTDTGSAAGLDSLSVTENEPVTALGPSAEPDDANSFVVTLQRDLEGSLGIHCVREEGLECIHVIGKILEGGPAAVWNAQESRVLRAGDRIVCVDGGPCDAAGLTGSPTQASQRVALSVERWPEIYRLSLTRPLATDRYGMAVELVERADGSHILRVGEIVNGVLENWNKQAKDDKRFLDMVTPWTELESVNGVTEDHDRMMSSLQGMLLELVLKRPSPGTVERMQKATRMSEAPRAG